MKGKPVLTLFKKKPEPICGAFPAGMRKDAACVLQAMAAKQYKKRNRAFRQGMLYRLEEGTVFVPLRYFANNIPAAIYAGFNNQQKEICCCLYLLNQNGYVRETYLTLLLAMEPKPYMLPFFMQIAADYVKEILQRFVKDFNPELAALFPAFCAANKKQVYVCYSRMVSYWNEYYRFEVVRPCVVEGRQGIKPYLKGYIGYTLFHACFTYSPQRKRGKQK